MDSSASTTDQPSLTRSTFFATLITIALLAASYAPVWENEFVNYDDPDYVTSNTYVQSGLNFESVRWAFITSHAANWHPVTWLSHMLDVELFGSTSATGPHVVNVVLHGLSGIVLFLLLVYATGKPIPSFFVMALWLVHPCQVETVAWISQRKSVLSGFFALLSLVLYVRHATVGSRGAHTLSLVAYVLSLMSKPAWVAMPFLLLLWDLWPLRRWPIPSHPSPPRSEPQPSIQRLLLEKAPFAILSAASCIVTIIAQTPAMSGTSALPLGVRFATAMVSYLDYIGVLLWPTNLAVLYPHPLDYPSAGRFFTALAVLVGLTLLSGIQWRTRPFLIVGWLWFLITMLPTIGIIQVGSQVMADRYLYVPSIGLFIAMVWGVATTAPGAAWRWLGIIVGSLCILGMSAATNQQVRVWRDTITLFERAHGVAGDHWVIATHLGTAYLEQGDTTRALEWTQKAYDLGHRDVVIIVSLATLHATAGDRGAAKRLLEEARSADPTHADTYLHLGEIALIEGRRAEGIAWLRECLRLDPENERALKLLKSQGALPP